MHFPDSLDHLQQYLTSLDHGLLEKAGMLVKMKVETARVRHAELLVELRRLEKEAAETDNRHTREHFEKLIQHIKPRIKEAHDTILPFIRR